MTSERIHSVLVFDDNPADARLIEEALRECGHRCQLLCVNSPACAKQVLATQSFDLFLSDFGTDPQSAADFLSSVRTLCPLLPIVVLSGTVDPNPAYAAGANVFVQKASGLQDFFAQIQSIVHFWLEVAKLPRQTQDRTSHLRDFPKSPAVNDRVKIRVD